MRNRKPSYRKLRIQANQLVITNGIQAKEISDLRDKKYSIERMHKEKIEECEALQRNLDSAYSFRKEISNTLIELKGVLIGAKFVDDQKKVRISFEPHEHFPPRRRPMEQIYTTRDEVMERLEFVQRSIANMGGFKS